MRFSTLSDWLDWQQTLHPKEIDLGLSRVRKVAHRLNILKPAKRIITVAGTNGKGSTVAYYHQLLTVAGYTVGSYTSPHLLRYNERIRIHTQEVDDAQIMQAFMAIDEARGTISLSYFEFSTLAALYCFKQHDLDYAVLEVGLGGRLDAVNIVDANLVHFTPIGIDHTEWLGETRELIAGEKAGVLRPHCKVVCNDPNPTNTLLQAINNHQAQAVFVGKDYGVEDAHFYMGASVLDLTSLNLVGQHQHYNCAGVLAGLQLLSEFKQLSMQQMLDCLSNIQLAGRYQTVQHNEQYQIIVDVGHNADAAQVISEQLKKTSAQHVVLILGMLKDKSIEEFIRILEPQIDLCVCMTLQGSRALSAEALAQRTHLPSNRVNVVDTMEVALQQAKIYLQNQHQAVSSESAQDIILITGSFLTVEAYFKVWNSS